MALRPIRLLF